MLMSFTHYAIVHIYGVSILSRFYLKKKKKKRERERERERESAFFSREKANCP